VLPSLQEQPGFVDFFALSNRTNAERLVCNGFWTSREDAEECHRQHLETITNMLQPVLESPRLKTFAEGVRQQCIALPEPPRGGTLPGFASMPECLSAIPETPGAGNRFTEDANNGGYVNPELCTEDTLTRRCDLLRQLQQHYSTGLNSPGLLRLRLCRLRESKIRDARFGNRSHRRPAFEAGFVFVAECVEEWKRSQRMRVQAFHDPSSLDSIDVAGVRTSKKEVMRLSQFPRRPNRLKARAPARLVSRSPLSQAAERQVRSQQPVFPVVKILLEIWCSLSRLASITARNNGDIASFVSTSVCRVSALSTVRIRTCVAVENAMA